MRADVVAAYDGIANLVAGDSADSTYGAFYDRPHALSLLGDVRARRVLDAGCGPGYYSEELVRRGADVVAIDASPRMVALCRQRLRGSAHVDIVDLDGSLPFPAESFDAVVCALVVLYLSDRRAALREFFRVVRHGGRVVISTQHPTGDWLRKGGSYFETREECDVWRRAGRDFQMRYWREPLSATCSAIADAGFLIERIVEPIPSSGMKARWPGEWRKLTRRPGVIMFALIKPPPECRLA